MRILFVNNYFFPYEEGGYEQLCRDVALRLARRGHEINVLTSRFGADHPAALKDSNRVHRVLITQPDYRHRLGPAWQFFVTRAGVDAHNRRWLRKVIAQTQPDIVFIWNLHGLTRHLALDAEALPGVAVAYWLAGYSPAEPDEFWHYWSIQPKLRTRLGSLKSAIQTVAYAIMRREGLPLRPAMSHVAVVSYYSRTAGITNGTLPDHTRVIYNGVETELFQHPVQPRQQEPLRLLLASRLSPEKGVHTAIEAMGHLVREQCLHDVQLTIVGAGRPDYEAHLHDLVRQLGLDAYVTFIGWQPREEIAAILARHHVFLLPPPHPEAFSRAVLEAMASGLAVIATDTGGTAELVRHGETGLLFAAGDSQQLAAQIERLAADDDLRQHLATAGQRIVCGEFDLERMVDNVEAFLQVAWRDQSPQHFDSDRAAS